MVESGTNSLLGPLPCNENRSFIPHIIGKAVVAQTPIGPVYIPSMRERKVERQNDTDSGKPVTL